MNESINQSNIHSLKINLSINHGLMSEMSLSFATLSPFINAHQFHHLNINPLHPVMYFYRSEHERHSAECPFVRGDRTENVPMCGKLPQYSFAA